MSIFILVTVYYVWVSDKNKFRSFLWGKKLALDYYVDCLKPATLSKKRLRHSCFPRNLAEFLRTNFLQNTSGFYNYLHVFIRTAKLFSYFEGLTPQSVLILFLFSLKHYNLLTTKISPDINCSQKKSNKRKKMFLTLFRMGL